MQIPGLVALLFGLASLGAAPASDQSQAASGSVATSVKADSLNSAAKAMPIDKFRPANERPHNFDPRNLGSIHIEEKRDSVCYTMRSYIMARENRDSRGSSMDQRTLAVAGSSMKPPPPT